MSEPIRIFIVDDLRLLREGLVSLLAEQEDLTVIGAAASGSKALETITALRPEVVLIDLGLPGKDGLTVTHALRRARGQGAAPGHARPERGNHGVYRGRGRWLCVERRLL